jgi:Uma2 family endonuclease
MSQIVSLDQLDLVNGHYNYADYLTWKFEQTVELIKGKILPMAAPSRKHQDISRELNGIFYEHFKNHPCRFYAAPFDVRFLNQEKSKKASKNVFTVVQPDVCIVCDRSKLDEKGCLGAPDLIVEILSPGNSTKEMKTKKLLYQENGVLEYWIFDPERETATQFHLLESGVYSSPTIYVSEESLECVIFPDLKFGLEDIFRND